MCGRFALYADPNLIKSKLNLDEPVDVEPRYNIAPSENICVIVDDENKRVARYFHWGLIPFWAKDKKIGYSMINARAETISDKPAFRHAFKKQRCLIVMSGFFEWREIDGRKQPYYIYPDDKTIMICAGIWEQWEDKKNNETINSCAIITTNANEFMQPIHNRMPVILSPDNYDDWLKTDNQDTFELTKLLQPYPKDDLNCHKVTASMSNARYKKKEAVLPLE